MAAECPVPPHLTESTQGAQSAFLPILNWKSVTFVYYCLQSNPAAFLSPLKQFHRKSRKAHRWMEQDAEPTELGFKT